MSAFLTRDILDTLSLAGRRKPDGSARLAVVSNDRRVPVRRRWATGFAVDADHARHLRGSVELYRGDTLLGRGLIYLDDADDVEHRFEFKRLTRPDEAQPVDFVRNATAPRLTFDPAQPPA